EAAPLMLELKLSSKAPQVARQWLDEQVGNAIAGLIPVAAGRGKLAEAAVEYLREKKQQGYEEVIRRELSRAPAARVEKVRGAVLEHAEKTYEPFDDKSKPRWLRAALEEAKGSQGGKLPAWLRAERLPPLVVGDRRLDDAQVEAVLAALQTSKA